MTDSISSARRGASASWPRRLARLPLCGLAVVGLAGGAGCSSEDDSGGLTLTCMEFRPDAQPQDGTVTADSGSQTTCSRSQVDFIVRGIDNIGGARFTLCYPNAIVLFDGFEDEGSFLSSDGNPILTEVQVEAPPSADCADRGGEVTVALTRVGPVQGISPQDGNDLLISLFFDRIAFSGDQSIAYRNESLESPGTPGTPPVPILGVDWRGGRFVIVQN
jgi:hypothetical protein